MNRAARVLASVAACLGGLGIALQACAQALPGPGTGYTCCNFHYDGDWISDANWSSLPKIPAGTRARILEYGDNRVGIEVDGRRMFLGLDYGRRQNLKHWAQQMIVAQDPKDRIANWPAAARKAIDAGRVALGMSKEQVIVAVGYPPAHATSSMDQPQWKYWYDTHGTYMAVWDGSGHLKDVVAPPPIRYRVLAESEVDASPRPADGPVQLKDLEGLLPVPSGANR